MFKQVLSAIAVVMCLSSCTAFKSLSFTSNRQVSSPSLATSPAKFIEDISVTPQVFIDKTEVRNEHHVEITTPGLSLVETPVLKEDTKQISDLISNRSTEVESASTVQLKYAVLLNTELESLPNKALLESVDEWYGVRYRTGGNTKSGVDCSGFTVAVFLSVYGINLPRVAKEQYRISRKVSTTELQEGDLVFFNTHGSGITHVGVYLGNNRFIHATCSKGVMVNSIFDSYYVKRFVGAGRIDDKQIVASN